VDVNPVPEKGREVGRLISNIDVVPRKPLTGPEPQIVSANANLGVANAPQASTHPSSVFSSFAPIIIARFDTKLS
jgi:hypothetical protein